MQKPNSKAWLAGAVLLVVGSLFIGAGASGLLQDEKFAGSVERAEARVSALETQSVLFVWTMCSAQISYEGPEGKSISKDGVCMSPATYQLEMSYKRPLG